MSDRPTVEFHCENLVRLPVRIVAGVRHPLAQRKAHHAGDARHLFLGAAAARRTDPQCDRQPVRRMPEYAAPVPLVESTSIRLNYELMRDIAT